MEVLVDKGELTILRLVKKFCQPQLVKLPLGDLLIVGGRSGLLLERKTVPDLISSIRSNRLWSQLLRMMKTEDILGYEVKRRMLVIQGGFWEYTNVSHVNEERFWGSIFGMLIAINYEYDTPCIVCENNQAFEIFLRILLQREEKGKNNSLPKGRWYERSASKLPVKDAKEYVLDAIPMIGEARAKILLNSFGSISKIAASSKSELMRVPSIGEKRAEKIYEIFH